MTMDELQPGQSAYITAVGGEGALRHHLLDMGLTPGTEVTLQKIAPMGDPVQMKVRGYELTLRLSEAQKIDVDHVHEKEAEAPKQNVRYESIEHPGVGELGQADPTHVHDEKTAVPKGGKLTFALAGNQNCGKTTLFNQLTGANQHVGNFPGVTVDRKDGTIRNHPEATVTDLPGIYSLSPYSSEEIVTREFLIEGKPSGIINIVDASNLERNLCLTMQLMELGIPMVLALNMMDEVRANGGTIRVNELEQILGIPVVPISAAKNEGIDELVSHAMHVARYHEPPGRIDFCPDSKDDKDPVGAVHRCIHAVAHMIENDAKEADLPVRFAATKLIEKDTPIEDALQLAEDKKEAFEQIVSVMEKETGLDREAAIADMRFQFIGRLCEKTVVRPHESKEHRRSVKIDKLLTGKYTAIPCFIGIMVLVFYLTFNVIGAFLQGILEMGIDQLSRMAEEGLIALNVNDAIRSLVIDGIFTGGGSVLSFLPIIVTLFFFLSMMEDSGYIARVAFVMDKLLRKIGLSGRSIVPMLIGFGCTVPAVMATRTLTSERDRRMTILLTPFMSCTAKLPIYAFFVSTFFPGKGGLIMSGLYVLGIVVGILIAFLYRGTLFKGEPVPFVMELPNYRLPGAKNVAQLLWEKAKDFLQKAFTVILMATIVVWFLQSFDLHLNLVENSADSILAMIAGALVPILRPLGLGDWRICTALISGFMAKESVVSTLEVLFGGGIASVLTPLSAGVLLVFSLLYTPCVAAVASVKRELGAKWAVGMVFWQCLIAWIAAIITRGIGMLFF